MPDFGRGWRRPIPDIASTAMTGYITGNSLEIDMSESSQNRAVRNYRARLNERGLARFEVLGAASDRDLIRSLARRLAEDGPVAAQLRATLSRAVSDRPPRKGGILEAFRRSPLVGADLDCSRVEESGRKVDL